MPAQKRPLSETSDDNNNRNQKKLVEVDAQGDDLVSSELDQQLRTQDMNMLLVGHTLPPCVATGTNSDYDDDDDDSPSSSSVKEEYVQVKLIDIRKEVQCPICLGIIRKTRTVMECLHRFCRECIDKSMRLGNNECPACRTHCASRRSLRDDPKYDALIAALYPDIDMYEEEEMILHEEEAYRNKMIQESMAETLRRQTEALGKRRPAVKAFSRKPGTSQRGRHRNVIRDTGVQGSDDDEEEVDGGCDENDDEGHREIQNVSPGQPETRDRLVWGKGGARSQTRHGNSGGITNGKSNKGSRVMKLVDYLHNLDEKENEFDTHLILIPLDKDSTPSLERPYICCQPNLSIKNICQFIALQISMQAEEIEILVRKPQNCGFIHKDEIVGLEEEFKILEAQDSLSGLHDFFCSSAGNLVLEYRIKT